MFPEPIKAFVIISDFGKYIMFSLKKEQAIERFKDSCPEEGFIACFEVNYNDIYILNSKQAIGG